MVEIQTFDCFLIGTCGAIKPSLVLMNRVFALPSAGDFGSLPPPSPRPSPSRQHLATPAPNPLPPTPQTARRAPMPCQRPPLTLHP